MNNIGDGYDCGCDCFVDGPWCGCHCESCIKVKEKEIKDREQKLKDTLDVVGD